MQTCDFLDCPHHQRVALSFFIQTGSKFLSQVLNSVRLVLLDVCHKPFSSIARKNSKRDETFSEGEIKMAWDTQETQEKFKQEAEHEMLSSASLTHLLRLEEIILWCFPVPKMPALDPGGHCNISDTQNRAAKGSFMLWVAPALLSAILSCP